MLEIGRPVRRSEESHPVEFRSFQVDDVVMEVATGIDEDGLLRSAAATKLASADSAWIVTACWRPDDWGRYGVASKGVPDNVRVINDAEDWDGSRMPERLFQLTRCAVVAEMVRRGLLRMQEDEDEEAEITQFPDDQGVLHA